MVVVYIAFTRWVTDWRAKLREQMNDLDTGAVAHAVDSLLNFETVKYFNAEEREARRYESRDGAVYANAAVKSENSLAWLNIGQALITNVMLGARDGAGRLWLELGQLHARATWCWSRPCSASCSARSTCSAWSIARSARA